MALVVGTRLGPYEIVSPLGRGGMGEVYRATDTRLGRSVAIKVVEESVSADPQYRQRLEREAKTISRLQHPNICTLYDIGFEGDVQYLVMEYIEGKTLAERLRAGALPLGDVLQIGREIAAAIEAAHRRSVVHRDLKPGNVMLGPAGTKVLDFGLAKVATAEPPPSVASKLPTLTEPITDEGRITGTMPYMSPEQLEGRRVDPRADIWALGCILYEMATGRRPFRGDSKPSLISSIMAREPQPMVDIEPDLPPRLAWVVERCLKKDPDERWQSARDLAIELGGVTEESSQIGLRPSRESESAAAAPAPKDRRYTWWPAAALSALLLGGLAAGYLLLKPPPRGPVVVEGTAVAVLPFENLTGNDQLDYIGLGMAAGLISQLSELPALNVVGRTRAWSANESARSQAELAEILGVNVVVEGSVLATGKNLQVDVAALDGQSSRVLWTDSFAGEQDALYELHQTISDGVARVLSVSLSPEERRRLARSGPSGKAFDYYLQGIERLEERANPRNFEFAADLFRQAIRLEGDVAIFHAALGNALARQNLEGHARASGEVAEAEARKALALDPKLPDAYLALARALRVQGRYAESVAELRPVLAKHPKPDEAFLELAFGYERTGDKEAYFRALESAIALGPENWFNWNALGVAQAENGRFEEAKISLARALELAPATVVWPRLNLGGVMIVLGDYQGAIEHFEATGATTASPELASNMATAYYALGRLEDAASLYRRAVALDPGDYVLHRNLGDALQALGRDSEALDEFAIALRLVEESLIERPHDLDLARSRVLYAAKTGNCEAAIRNAEVVRPILEASWKGQLDLAAAFALCERPRQALDAVKACVELGLPGHLIRQQAELESLVGNAEFETITVGTDR